MELKGTSKANVVIVDCGTGNLNSVKRALDQMGVKAVVSALAADIARADKVILPGVGHFGRAMTELERLGLRQALDETVLSKRKPILGICLGMELMAKSSEEGGAAGLGWLDAEAVKFKFDDRERYKSPHMGWNGVSIKKDSELMRGVEDGAEFYFAHSYFLRARESTDKLCETEYESAFTSAVERDNIFGTQFHPEKSHDAGRRVLRNFVEM